MTSKGPTTTSEDPEPTIADEPAITSAVNTPTTIPDGTDGEYLRPGDTAGAYVIEEVTSQGGFASVYKARSKADGKRVALKLLWRELAASARLQKRFEHEAKALLALRHPNIVEVIEYGTLPDGRPFFAMEWLGGRTLREMIRAQGPFPPNEAVALMEEIGAALRAAHASGIIHRDLKAANIMIVPKGEWLGVKLVDFGIAKVLDPEKVGVDDFVTTSTILGTPFYMAPEQILGQSVDQRTDVYSLGLLLFEMLTGELPFKAETRIEVEEMHLHAPPPKASDLAAVPVAFDAIIARCMAKEPPQRYPSVNDVLADLRQSLAEPVAPRATTAIGAGIHVEARIDPDLDDVPDEIFDDVDAIIDEAQRDLGELGMKLDLQSGNGVLGVVVLPENDRERLATRQRIVRDALALGERLGTRATKNPHVEVAITVHAAPVVLKPGQAQPDEGELLRLGEWTKGHPGRGVAATKAAAGGVEGILAETIPGTALLKISTRR
jgi:serine/threonine-protein kinase